MSTLKGEADIPLPPRIRVIGANHAAPLTHNLLEPQNLRHYIGYVENGRGDMPEGSVAKARHVVSCRGGPLL
jgi:hypothetical protein